VTGPGTAITGFPEACAWRAASTGSPRSAAGVGWGFDDHHATRQRGAEPVALLELLAGRQGARG
jgi:hypothetical protein